MVWFRMFIERWKDAQETGDHRRPKKQCPFSCPSWHLRSCDTDYSVEEHLVRTLHCWHLTFAESLLDHCWTVAESLLNHCWIIADRASTCVSVHVTLVTSVLKGDGLITVDLDFYAVYRTTATNSGILWWLPFEKRKMKTWQENACEEVWCC